MRYPARLWSETKGRTHARLYLCVARHVVASDYNRCAMVVILISRCVKRNRVDEFLKGYSHPNCPGFVDEVLTRASDERLPESLRSLNLDCKGGVRFVNIAIWESWQQFEACFRDVMDKPNLENEMRPPSRIVLDIVNPSEGFLRLLAAKSD